MFKTTVTIDGMACGMCEAHVNDAVRRCVPGARKVKSSFRKGMCSFVSREMPDRDLLKEALETAGYRVLSLETAVSVRRGPV